MNKILEVERLSFADFINGKRITPITFIKLAFNSIFEVYLDSGEIVFYFNGLDISISKGRLEYFHWGDNW